MFYKKKYTNYEDSLLKLNLDSLYDERRKICLKFAKDSIENNKLNDLFPENSKNHTMKTRKQEKYEVYPAHTSRLKKSGILYMRLSSMKKT